MKKIFELVFVWRVEMKCVFKRLFALTAMASAVLFLSACGGDGGGSKGVGATPMTQGQGRARALAGASGDVGGWVRIASEGGDFPTTGTRVGRYGSGSDLCEDPATGNFLALSQGNLRGLDPTGAGRWARLSAGRIPPPAVVNPTAPHGVTCTPIREHDLVAYTTQTSSTGGTFHL